MARTEEEMYRMIAILTNLSIYTGLRIYKKTSIIIFNKREQLDHIKNTKVAKKIKYLGITSNEKICFKMQKENSIQKAKKLVNVTYPVITQSCNRILIEKTFEILLFCEPFYMHPVFWPTRNMKLKTSED